MVAVEAEESHAVTNLVGIHFLLELGSLQAEPVHLVSQAPLLTLSWRDGGIGKVYALCAYWEEFK